jgi:hypothetical protein
MWGAWADLLFTGRKQIELLVRGRRKGERFTQKDIKIE